MSEAKAPKETPKKEDKKIEVFTKRSIWVADGAKAKKIPAGKVVELTEAEVKHFKSSVTRDLPDTEE